MTLETLSFATIILPVFRQDVNNKIPKMVRVVEKQQYAVDKLNGTC